MLSYPLNNILFLDIETVPQFAAYSDLPEFWKSLWDNKANILVKNKEDETAETIYPRAGIYAEFGKIICISCGVIQGSGEQRKLVLKSFSGDDEKLLLVGFSAMLNKWTADGSKYLCAHNGKEFDFPYLCRRLLINGLPIPLSLNTAGKKPWEISHLDTMEAGNLGIIKAILHSTCWPTHYRYQHQKTI